jgi:thioesterase domain-containing protein
LPRHDLDRSLQAVWEAVLGRTQCGIDDDFFALGGDSMLAIRLVKEMHRATGLEYPLSTLFASPTIRDLVDAGGDANERAASVVRLNSASGGTPIYCLAGVQLYRRFAEYFTDAPVYGVYAKEELAGIDAGLAGVSSHVATDLLVQRYADAVARHANQKRLVLAGLSFGGLMALEAAAVLKSRGYDIAQVVLFDAIPSAAYTRSLKCAVADLTRRVTSEGFFATVRGLAQRPYSKVAHHGVLAQADSAPDGHAIQAKLFDDWTDAYDPRLERYEVDVLLVKASRQALGIGTALKPDYGLGDWVTGRLDVAEVDADHIGMVSGAAVTRLYEIVADLFRSREILVSAKA